MMLCVVINVYTWGHTSVITYLFLFLLLSQYLCWPQNVRTTVFCDRKIRVMKIRESVGKVILWQVIGLCLTRSIYRVFLKTFVCGENPPGKYTASLFTHFKSKNQSGIEKLILILQFPMTHTPCTCSCYSLICMWISVGTK